MVLSTYCSPFLTESMVRSLLPVISGCIAASIYTMRLWLKCHSPRVMPPPCIFIGRAGDFNCWECKVVEIDALFPHPIFVGFRLLLQAFQ